MGIEDGFVLEHEIDGPGQLDGHDGVGFELVAAVFGFKALGQGADDSMIAFGNDGGFAKGPAQIRVAEFGSAQALDFSGACDGAFDQSAVGKEVFDGGKTGDVANLVEDGQAEAVADSCDAQEQGKVTGGNQFGLALKLPVELGDLLVEVGDHGHVVFECDLAQGMILRSQEPVQPGIAVGAALFGRNTVMSELVGTDAGEQLGAAPDEVDALAQKCAQRAFS